MCLTTPFSVEQRWAVVRLTFGFVQMFGAVFALTLILWTGVTVWSMSFARILDNDTEAIAVHLISSGDRLHVRVEAAISPD